MASLLLVLGLFGLGFFVVVDGCWRLALFVDFLLVLRLGGIYLGFFFCGVVGCCCFGLGFGFWFGFAFFPV